MSDLDDLHDAVVREHHHGAGRPQRRSKAEHGTRARYVAGCSCDPCRVANKTYQADWYQRNHAAARDSRNGWRARQRREAADAQWAAEQAARAELGGDSA